MTLTGVGKPKEKRQETITVAVLTGKCGKSTPEQFKKTTGVSPF